MWGSGTWGYGRNAGFCTSCRVNSIFELNFNYKLCTSFHSVSTRVEPGEFDHIFECSFGKGLKILCPFSLFLYLQSFTQQNRSPQAKMEVYEHIEYRQRTAAVE